MAELSDFPGATIAVPIKIGIYQSTLYKLPADFSASSKADIVAECEKRESDWRALVAEQSSKPPVVLTKEQLTESATAQADLLGAVTAQIVTAKMTAKEVEVVVAKLQASLDALKALSAEVKP